MSTSEQLPDQHTEHEGSASKRILRDEVMAAAVARVVDGTPDEYADTSVGLLTGEELQEAIDEAAHRYERQERALFNEAIDAVHETEHHFDSSLGKLMNVSRIVLAGVSSVQLQISQQYSAYQDEKTQREGQVSIENNPRGKFSQQLINASASLARTKAVVDAALSETLPVIREAASEAHMALDQASKRLKANEEEYEENLETIEHESDDSETVDFPPMKLKGEDSFEAIRTLITPLREVVRYAHAISGVCDQVSKRLGEVIISLSTQHAPNVLKNDTLDEAAFEEILSLINTMGEEDVRGFAEKTTMLQEQLRVFHDEVVKVRRSSSL